MNIGTVTIRSPEFGDTELHETKPTTRIVGTTVKTVRRETPHGYAHNYTVRGLCLEDRVALVNEIVANLGTIILVNGSQAIIHDEIIISEDTAGYNVSFTVEYVI